MDQPPILILGVGNILMGDEGLGVRALEALAARHALPPEAEAVDGGVMGLDLLPYLEDRQVLLILDAIQTSAPPGTLVRLEGDAVPKAFARKMSMHQVGLQELLAVAQLKGCRPPRIIAWGMVPEEISPGVHLSATIRTRLGALVDAAAEELVALAAPTRPATSK